MGLDFTRQRIQPGVGLVPRGGEEVCLGQDAGGVLEEGLGNRVSGGGDGVADVSGGQLKLPGDGFKFEGGGRFPKKMLPEGEAARVRGNGEFQPVQKTFAFVAARVPRGGGGDQDEIGVPAQSVEDGRGEGAVFERGTPTLNEGNGSDQQGIAQGQFQRGEGGQVPVGVVGINGLEEGAFGLGGDQTGGGVLGCFIRAKEGEERFFLQQFFEVQV